MCNTYSLSHWFQNFRVLVLTMKLCVCVCYSAFFCCGCTIYDFGFFLNLSIFVPIRWPSLLNYMQACSLNMSKWLSA
jgi:hypothetical protein